MRRFNSNRIEAEHVLDDLDVLVTGHFSPGDPGTSGFGIGSNRGMIGRTHNPEPPTPDEMEDVCVYLCRNVVKDGVKAVEQLDITEFLSEKQLEQATQELWDRLSQRGRDEDDY